MASKNRPELDKGCVYCENASTLQNKDFMLCSRYGIVNAGHSCRHFSYDPLKRIPAPRKKIDSDFEFPTID